MRHAARGSKLERLPRQRRPSRAPRLPAPDGRARHPRPPRRRLPAGAPGLGAGRGRELEPHARRPLLPFGARALTALHHGWLRSALTGEADAILTRRPARSLGSKVVGRSGLRRIAHAVELDGVTVVNLHLDPEPAQLERAVALAGERAILAGDTNVPSLGADGFSPPLEGSIDQILVRGLALREGPAAWPPERRTVAGRLLSDHAPVEAVVG